MKSKTLVLSVMFMVIFSIAAGACIGPDGNDYWEGYNAPEISIAVASTAANGSQILVPVTVVDDHGINYISFFDGQGYWLGGYFCGNTTKCDVSFQVTVPTEVGVQYTYKAYVYDIDGYSAMASGSGITIAEPVIIPPVVPPYEPEEQPEAGVAVATFFIENADFIKAGDMIRFFYNVENYGDTTLKEVTFSASIPYLGVKAPSLRMQKLDDGDSVSRMQYIELPKNIAPGTYYLQLSINSRDVRRVVYREFIVTA
jgi:hypothetical protein